MTAGARFSVFALLAVFVIGWGLVATTPTPQPRTAPAAPTEPEPEPEPEPARSPTLAPGETPSPPPSTLPTNPAPGGPRLERQPGPELGEEGVVRVGRDPVAEAYADRERVVERNVVRYDAARERFDSEPRDSAWATEREVALQAIVVEAGIGELIESLECKSTLCQLRMRFNGLTAAGTAVRLAPLAQAIGPDRVLRNEGPPDQRMMVIYLPRDGWPDDAPGEEPALDGK